MPSTVIHVGFAALIAAALLHDDFDASALAVVLGFTVLPDLDTLIGIPFQGLHRAALHNVVLPLAVLAGLAYDTRVRDTSFVADRYGDRGVRLLWVGVAGGWIVAGVLVDAFHNGANVLWPLHDEFIDLSGHLWLSDQRGVVQTIISFDGFAVADEHSVGTTADTHYYTGVNPGDDAPEDVERIFPIFDRADLGVVAVTGYVVAALRLRGSE